MIPWAGIYLNLRENYDIKKINRTHWYILYMCVIVLGLHLYTTNVIFLKHVSNSEFENLAPQELLENAAKSEKKQSDLNFLNRFLSFHSNLCRIIAHPQAEIFLLTGRFSCHWLSWSSRVSFSSKTRWLISKGHFSRYPAFVQSFYLLQSSWLRHFLTRNRILRPLNVMHNQVNIVERVTVFYLFLHAR